MKNKKLIATVASLCLVLVAVVAAVVGVLAAANQYVANKVSIKYTANDVNVTVGAFGKDETAESFTQLLKKDNVLVDSYTFAKKDAVTHLAAEEFNSALTSSNRYIVYKMTFQNESTAHAMNITGTYTFATAGGTTVVDDNVQLWYIWTADDLDSTAKPASYDTNDIVVAPTAGGTWTEIKQENSAANQTLVYNLTQRGGSHDATSTVKLYIVVALKDLNKDATYLLGSSSSEGFSGKTGNTLEFNMSQNRASDAV